jgi:hypothetical protein
MAYDVLLLLLTYRRLLPVLSGDYQQRSSRRAEFRKLDAEG